MKKNQLTGWYSVYQFTIVQNIKNKAYLISTAVITLLVVAACICIHLLPAIVLDLTSSRKDEIKNIRTVYVLDESGLTALDYKEVTQELQSTEAIQVEAFSSVNEWEDLLVQQANGQMTSDAVLVRIVKQDRSYQIIASIAEKGEVTKDEAGTLASHIATYFKTTHTQELQLTQQQIALKELPVTMNVIKLGEQDDGTMWARLVEYIVNITLIFVFMLLIISYGKMTSSIVAMEKSGKVIELLLTSVRPLATIIGKIFAMVTLLLAQIGIWIVVGTITFFSTDAILRTMDAKYNEGFVQIFQVLKEQGIVLNLSVEVVLVAIIILVTGFTVYISIAGFFGAMVGKIEELGQSLQTFSFIAVIGAYIPLFGYIQMLSSDNMNNVLLNITRVLPISSMYMIPAGMILGTHTIGEGLLAIGINAVTLVLLLLFISSVYEFVILHNGNRLQWKDLMKTIQGK